ncbi:oligosaccharide flippase family protein [Lentilactobacillus hilgardii]|uniref:oligosaccharide flippase family protein n=1 Tax=Lentilactobacillus hilgardii TaxID=1588 RepID=UPI0021A7CCEC|nr:oligosaccharide flippase family protein [Lentilactobacillus hilgardii]MCT3391394.1 teichoic acid transporter [Lentilactobacillus hilgardii]
MNKTIRNIIYNGLYQLLVIALPVITVPYVARVLGAHSLGINSYVVSIGNLLAYVIFLGLNQFGVRTIARSSQKKIVLENEFYNLWIIQLIVGIVVLCGYIYFATLNSYSLFLLANVPYLLGYVIDISWFFIGVEQIKEVVIRNSIVKLITVLFIFILVRSPKDLFAYILINACSILFSNIIFWEKLFKVFSGFHFIFRKRSLKYFLPLVILGAPQIAVQLYTSFDSTLVGTIAGPTQLSYYDQSQKVVRIVLALVTSVSTVIMPKLSQLDKEDNRNYFKILKFSLDVTLISSLFIVLNLMIDSNEFVPWFFGTKFNEMKNNMFFVSLILIFVSYGGVFANQFALSRGLYKEYSIPYFIGAAISIPLNIVFVNKYGADGGTFTIILTEFIVCLLRVLIVHKRVNYNFLLRGQWKFILSMIISLGVGLEFKIYVSNLLLTMILNSIMSTILFIFLLSVTNITYINRLFRSKILKK